MLRPSYSELMEKLNRDKTVDDQITSRYTIVLAAAKRARQLIDGAHPLTYAPTDRAVSIAIKELAEGKLIIKIPPEASDNPFDKVAAPLYYQAISSISKDDLREDFKDNYTTNDKTDEDDIDGSFRKDKYKEEFDSDKKSKARSAKSAGKDLEDEDLEDEDPDDEDLDDEDLEDEDLEDEDLEDEDF
jgi:DNA-directed RNA polymerase subunit omega